jgi:hypothetical protein
MDATEIVTAPQEIDLFALLEGQEYPEREITVYTNTKAAADVIALKDGDPALFAAAKDKLKDTSLIFTVRGLEPGIVQDIYATEDDAADVNKENVLIAKSIVSVKTGTGAKVTTAWDSEAVSLLRRKLPLSEITKLIGQVVEVNFDSALFDNAVDAGFPG